LNRIRIVEFDKNKWKAIVGGDGIKRNRWH
jgi:hypothetical protein